VSAVLDRVLAKSPDERFPSATEFVRGLTRALESTTAPAAVTEIRPDPAATPTCTLTVVHGPRPGEIHALDTRPFVLGREAGADLVVDDSRVSRRHFRITSNDGAYWIEDLGAGNGTFVNGARIDSRRSCAMATSFASASLRSSSISRAVLVRLSADGR